MSRPIRESWSACDLRSGHQIAVSEVHCRAGLRRRPWTQALRTAAAPARPTQPLADHRQRLTPPEGLQPNTRLTDSVEHLDGLLGEIAAAGADGTSSASCTGAERTLKKLRF